MVECPSEAWDRYIYEEEKKYEGACIEAAEKHGISRERALLCEEDDDYGCEGCPYKNDDAT